MPGRGPRLAGDDRAAIDCSPVPSLGLAHTTNEGAMAPTPYDTDLDRNPANFQPLTPLTFLERAAAVFPDHTAVIHGKLKRSYAEFYARTRRLASALSKRGIGRGDT